MRLGAETEPGSAMPSAGFPCYFSLHLYPTVVEYHATGYKCRKRKNKSNLHKVRLLGVVDSQGCGVIQERQFCVKYDIT